MVSDLRVRRAQTSRFSTDGGLLTRFIREKLAQHVEPTRLGTPRGAPIGCSRKKMTAALFALTHADVKQTAKEVRQEYEIWCRDSGVRFPLSARKLAARLEARGCRQHRGHAGTRFWEGIRSARRVTQVTRVTSSSGTPFTRFRRTKVLRSDVTDVTRVTVGGGREQQSPYTGFPR